MEFSYRIKEAKKEYVQAENTDKIHVVIDILKGEEVVEQKSLGYALGFTKDQIIADLDQILKTYNEDHQRSIENAAHEAQQASADETIKALLGDTPADEAKTESTGEEAKTA